MKIAMIQSDLYWESPAQNLQHFAQILKPVKADIIVLPEMYTTGFTMNIENVNEHDNLTAVVWMKKMAKQLASVIIGSIVFKEGAKAYNRLFWVDPEGKIATYDKRHLFRMADEDQFFNAGEERLIVNYKGIRFCPLICYDLRFPVWSRNVDEQGKSVYDCLIYIANWPAARSDAWTSLLKARAIENQVYVVGVNRVGTDGKGILYSGNSRAFDPKGNRMDNLQEGQNGICTIELDIFELNAFREKFPVGKDADTFQIMK